MRTRVVTNTLSRNQACLKCRSRKVRCSAERPGCDACKRSAGARGEDPSLVCCVYISPPPWGEKEPETEEVESKVESTSEDKLERYSLRKNRRTIVDSLRDSSESPSKSLSSSKSKMTKLSSSSLNPNSKDKSINSNNNKVQKRKRLQGKAGQSQGGEDIDGEGSTDDELDQQKAEEAMTTHGSCGSTAKSQYFRRNNVTASPIRHKDLSLSPLSSASISPPPHPMHSSRGVSKTPIQDSILIRSIETTPPIIDFSSISSSSSHPPLCFPDQTQAPSPTFSNFSASTASEESLMTLASSNNSPLSMFHNHGHNYHVPGAGNVDQMSLQYFYLPSHQKLVHSPITQPIDVSPLPPATSLPTPFYNTPTSTQTMSSLPQQTQAPQHLSQLSGFQNPTPYSSYPISMLPTSAYIPSSASSNNYQSQGGMQQTMQTMQPGYLGQYSQLQDQIYSVRKNEMLSPGPGLEIEELNFQNNFTTHYQNPEDVYSTYYPTQQGVIGLGFDFHNNQTTLV